MKGLSRETIEEFCKLCNWAYEVWFTRRKLFDDNPEVNKLMVSQSRDFFVRLSEITLDYAFLQVMKLHDPSVIGKDINLTIEYIVEYGAWDQQTRIELNKLVSKLNELKEQIKPARNKIICHNDLKTILRNKSLGEFKNNGDMEYFETLQEFVNIVNGDVYPFNDLAKADVEIFLNYFLRGLNNQEKI